MCVCVLHNWTAVSTGSLHTLSGLPLHNGSSEESLHRGLWKLASRSVDVLNRVRLYHMCGYPLDTVHSNVREV